VVRGDQCVDWVGASFLLFFYGKCGVCRDEFFVFMAEVIHFEHFDNPDDTQKRQIKK